MTVSSELPSRPPRLGEILVQHNLISPEQLDEALRLQRESGAFLGQVLVELGLTTETDLSGFMSKHCKVPYMSLLDYLVDSTMLQHLPREVCLTHRVLPIDKLGSNLTVAMVNPTDPEALAAVQAHCHGLRVKPILCDYSHFEQVAATVLQKPGKKAPEATMSASSLGLGPAAEKPVAPTPPPDPKPAAPAARATASVPAAPAPPKANPLMEDMMAFARESMHDTYAVFAHRIPLFGGLAPEEIAAVFAYGSTREVSAGSVIFEQGSEGAELFVILAGTVAVQVDGAEVEQLATGAMFGEMALVTGEVRAATVVALETTSLFVLNEATFQRLLSKEAAVRILLNIIGSMSARIRDLNAAREIE